MRYVIDEVEYNQPEAIEKILTHLSPWLTIVHRPPETVAA